MRVMCIDNDLCQVDGSDVGILELYGKYTVVKVLKFFGDDMYVLEEVPARNDGRRFMFDADAFVPLDGPDERAILESRYDAEVARMDEEFRQIVHEAEKA